MKGYVVLSIKFHQGDGPDQTFRIGPYDDQPEDIIGMFQIHHDSFQFQGEQADLPGWSAEAFFCIPKTSVRMATWGYLPEVETEDNRTAAQRHADAIRRMP